MAETPAWITPSTDGFVLTIWAQPGAKRTEPAGVIEGRLKVRLAAPPVDGKANDALVAWLADRLGLPQRSFRIVSGQTSRQKRVLVSGGATPQAIAERLLPGG